MKELNDSPAVMAFRLYLDLIEFVTSVLMSNKSQEWKICVENIEAFLGSAWVTRSRGDQWVAILSPTCSDLRLNCSLEDRKYTHTDNLTPTHAHTHTWLYDQFHLILWLFKKGQGKAESSTLFSAVHMNPDDHREKCRKLILWIRSKTANRHLP